MYAHVAIDVPLRTLFTYEVPKDLLEKIQIGSRVLVGFGRKKVIGFCMELSEVKATDREIKDIIDVVGAGSSRPQTGADSLGEKVGKKDGMTPPLLDLNYIEWLKFASEYYVAPIGQVLSQAVPGYYLDVKKIGSEKEVRSRSIETLFNSDFKTKDVVLTKKQMEIYEQISTNFHSYYPALIHGITGSGKTEIYIQLIKKALAEKKSALFLIPEIGLTPQMLARLNHHFKGKLLVYHSGLTQNQRLNQWNNCLSDEPQVMVGTRSALFSPFKNLGLIIVDEEHDSSYKQDDRFRYNARDLAVSRARGLDIPIVMGSATPSLESYYLAQSKKYHYIKLADRIGEARLPEIRVMDFGKEREQTGSALLVSQSIHEAIDHFYEKREQMIIFVGQRGFAQNAFCLSCSTVQLCPNCSVGLKYHKYKNNLKCHYCDYERVFDEICSSCKKKSLTLLGFGTQSIEEEIRSMHPSLVVARVDSDAANTPKKVRQIFNDFAKGKTNLMIGTQMISKGHDFSNVGFVGILGVDAHLGLPEFRAGERAFQTLVQVAGRAGRADKKGHVIVQSFMPEHASIQRGVEQDYEKFAEAELKLREELFYPPYSRIVQFRFLSNHENRLKDFLSTWNLFLNKLRSQADAKEFQILGPSEMPIAKVRGKYRHHVLFKIRRGLKFKDLLDYALKDLEARKLTGIQIDVDAVGLL